MFLVAPAQKAIWYLWLVGVSGTGVAIAYLPELFHYRMLPVVLLTVMAAFLEAFPVTVRQVNITLTVAVLLAVMVVYGNSAAIWTIAVGSILSKFVRRDKSSLSIEVFNIGQYVLSVWVMNWSFHHFYIMQSWIFGWGLLLAVGLACLSYIIVNNLLVQGIQIVRRDFKFREALAVIVSDGLNSIIILPFALLVIFVSPTFPWLSFAMVLPIVLLAYTLGVHEKTKAIQIIFRTATNLASEFDSKRICENVASIAQRLSGADEVAVYLINRDENSLMLASVWPSNSGVEHFPDRIQDTGESVTWHAVRNRSSVYIPYTRKGTGIPRGLNIDAHGYLTVAVYPMFTHTEIYGAIVCCSSRSYAFSYVQDYAKTLASQASVLLENARLYQELQDRSIRDGATGLYNYRYFYEALEHRVKSALDRDEPVSVAILDIDLFKKFNDTYGHLAGDEVLKSIGRLICDMVVPGSIVARYGGEEFALILPMDAGEAFLVVEEIRKAAARYEVDFHGYKLQGITFSSGVASCPLHTKNDRDLILKADSTMYWGAKQRGRNKTALYMPEYEAQLFVDELTGLYTFHFIDIRIREELTHGTSSWGVVAIDLNRFGIINETFGFGMGDKILRQAGMLVKESLRQGELACRYGGDEILVLLPNIVEDEVLVIGDRLAKAISCYRFIADTNVVVSVKARYLANTFGSVEDPVELFDYIGQMFQDLSRQNGSSMMETIS